MTEAPATKGPILQAADLPMDPSDIDSQATFGPVFDADVGVAPEPDTEDLSPEEQAERQAISDLDETAREDFVGLMRLGYLEDTCTVAGHRFLLRTPTHDERIERGNLHREYLGSLNTEPMWRLLTVAAYCVEIDDVPAPEPLNTKTRGVADRLRWVKETIFSSVVIERLFTESLLLDARERMVVEYLDGQIKA